jgi:CRISPR-associated exonuclease Cas4
MQNNENKYVSVSSIASYLICPRLAYFRNGHREGLTDREVRSTVFKSVSYSLARVISSQHPEAALGDEIRASCADALCIYGDAHRGSVDKAGDEIRSRAGAIISGISAETERRGRPQMIRILAPSLTGVSVYSDKMRISGAIDKVVDMGQGLMPILISASLPPPSGIFSSDRVRLAAYAMLLSEKYSIDCSCGGVEYLPGWCMRTADIRYEDKRKTLYARNRVLDIMGGRMPETSRGKWCEHCLYASTCSVRVSLLDSLYKK